MASVDGCLCICGLSFGPERFMIQCDFCKIWYHGDCVQIREYEAADLAKYHCPRCEPHYGPSTYNVQANWHRHDYTDTCADNKPVQTGTPVFITELKTRHFPSAESVLTRLRGQQLTIQYLHQQGFDRPIMIEDKDGLDLRLPTENFSIYDVQQLVGEDREVDVIDVCRQSDIRMKLKDLVHYYEQADRRRIYNVVSLEFSDTAMAPLVEAPHVARKLDWVNDVWPDSDVECDKPKVSKYCLIGAKDSYTDFHIDFGGTSVWYHVLRGEKVFYLIQPTQANLSLYQRWMSSPTQNEMFFGDQADCCYRCVVRRGNTLLIPTGWIHAVLTSVDSMVFGGNFLHSLNIPLQLQVYEMECKMHTPEKFRFPEFERINWHAGVKLVQELHDCRNSSWKGSSASSASSALLAGAKALVAALKTWNVRHRENIPSLVHSHKLLKDLAKEIRFTERYYNQLNPPKPERESKRKKRKPVNKDFVDFSSLRDEPFRTNSKSAVKKEGSGQPPPLKLLLPKAYTSLDIHRDSPVDSKPLVKDEIAKQEDFHLGDTTVSRPPLKLTLPKTNVFSYPSPSTAQGSNVLFEPGGDAFVSPDIKPAKHIATPKRRKRPLSSSQAFITQDNKIDEKTVAEDPRQESGTVLKFKLGSKEVLDKRKGSQSESVYDFHEDSDEDCLKIDENPKKGRPHHNVNAGTHVFVSDMEVAGEVDVISDTPKNGIEELLKASCYTQETAEYVESGRASPSTREAIAGMLSIGRCLIGPTETPTNRLLTSRTRTQSHSKSHSSIAEDVSESIDRVHQDDEYIYPSLDASDDEDAAFRPSARGKRPTDEAWNPKARLGPIGPKVNRPAREGAKKQAVEKGLEAAAAKRANLPPPKRPYNRKAGKVAKESVAIAVAVPVAGPLKAVPSTSSLSIPIPIPIHPISRGVINRPAAVLDSSPKRVKIRTHKKGMATAKQRLGKILKIHKMIH